MPTPSCEIMFKFLIILFVKIMDLKKFYERKYFLYAHQGIVVELIVPFSRYLLGLIIKQLDSFSPELFYFICLKQSAMLPLKVKCDWLLRTQQFELVVPYTDICCPCVSSKEYVDITLILTACYLPPLSLQLLLPAITYLPHKSMAHIYMS
jgi:hypothetical protein